MLSTPLQPLPEHATRIPSLIYNQLHSNHEDGLLQLPPAGTMHWSCKQLNLFSPTFASTLIAQTGHHDVYDHGPPINPLLLALIISLTLNFAVRWYYQYYPRITLSSQAIQMSILQSPPDPLWNTQKRREKHFTTILPSSFIVFIPYDYKHLPFTVSLDIIRNYLCNLFWLKVSQLLMALGPASNLKLT